MTDLQAKALDTNFGQFNLGNEVFPAAHATFVRNRQTPQIYDANHMMHVTARTPREIDGLFEAMEREFAHCGHRRFDLDFRTPPEFYARIVLDGTYERSEGLILLLEGELQGDAPKQCDIRPVVTDADWDAYWELQLIDWNETHERIGRTPAEEIARMMWESHKLKQPPVQNWLAYVGERAVAYFNSWEGVDGVGQVENLFTHPDFRNRGVARALIHHCVRESRAKGAGPVVIVADPTDTPKFLYASMGFRPVAVVAHYLKRLQD